MTYDAGSETGPDGRAAMPSVEKPTTSLDCRLLCACGLAYDIDPASGRYQPPPPGQDRLTPAVGFLAPPTPINAGPDRVDACLVGENGDGIVVAFRGTLPPSWTSQVSMIDWLQDVMAEPEVRPPLPGMVHTGFRDATAAIIREVIQEVKRLDPAGAKKVFVTGHSLGGAMASLGAYIMQAAPNGIAIEQVVTFASPKPGDGVFQAAYEKIFTDQVRYENHGDLVPLLPPADDLIRAAADIPLLGDLFKQAENWDYQAVGKLQYIESATDGYKVIGDRPLLMDERLLEIAGELADDVVHWVFSSFGAAHSSACGHGYMSGTCPAGVCGKPAAQSA
jgi:hypothetical protein